MSDLISRQMLLEYIHGEPVGRLLCDKYNLDGLIEQLPSAQPEIIRCKDCKHWTTNICDSELRDNYCNEAMHGFYYRCSGDDFCSYAESEDKE